MSEAQHVTGSARHPSRRFPSRNSPAWSRMRDAHLSYGSGQRSSPAAFSPSNSNDSDVVHGDHLALHAADVGDLRDAAHAVAHALDLDDQVDRAGDLGADRPGRQIDGGHLHHVLDPGQRVARGVGVDRADRAVVAGVHRLQHVVGLGAAHLAHDDPVGPHTQRVAQQLALVDLAAPFQVGGAGLQPHHVRLLQLQFGGVLDGDDAFVVRRSSRSARSAAWSCRSRCRRRSGCCSRHRAAISSRRATAGTMLPFATMAAKSSFFLVNLRIEMQGPSSASGGKITLTRLPSGSRASHSGLDSSTRRPIVATIFCATMAACSASRNRTLDRCSLPAPR